MVAASIWKLRATGSLPQEIDETEVRRAVAVLCGDGPAVEFRALPSGKSWVKRSGDLDGAIEAVRWLAENDGIYYTLNPVNSELIGLKRAAKKSDIASRRWLLIDIDAAKPADMSANDEEHANAQKLSADVRAWLMAFHQWPEPIIVDSGNGWHLLYRIDLPNDELSRVLCKGALAGIAAQFKDDVRGNVDTAVHDAPRIAKLPGTWARKGPNDPDRPHRICRLLYVPPIRVVTAEKLKRMAVKDEPTNPVNRVEGWFKRPLFTLKASTSGERSYVQSAINQELRNLEIAPEGERNKTLFKSGANLFEFVAGGCIDRGELESWLTERAIAIGLGEVETRSSIRSAATAGFKNPRRPPERNGVQNPKSKSNTEPSQEFDSIIIRASSITPKKVEWLWPGRIPLGKLTTFAGVGGLGKTFVLCDITARVSRGLEWPDSGGECAEQGQTLFVTGEDDNDDTLVPRLIELGADLSQVIFLRTEVQDQFTLRDLTTLDRAIEEAGSGVRFVAIDPPTAFLGGIDDHKNAELRGLLSPLKSWAAKHRVALVFNTHVNKPQGSKVEAMMRVMGSVAWVNAVRAAHMFAKDPEEPERRLFCCMKMNIGKEKKGLAYKLVSTGEMAKIEWLGEVETTADEAVNKDGGKPRRVIASEWLIERFREKNEWPSDDIMRDAKAAGLSRNAVWEAKDRLNLPKPRKVTLESGDVCWYWWVPNDWPQLAKDAKPSTKIDTEDF